MESPVRAQTLHQGTPNTSLRLAYNLETACGAQANKKIRSSGDARKGTGDTKTKWYYLGSTHFGITSAHTNLSPRNPKYTYLTDQVITVLILKAISTSSVLKRSTSPLYSPRALAIPTSNEHLQYQQYSLIPLIEANINVTLR